MAQNIGKRRGKSAIQTRLEQERLAALKDPAGKKAFTKGLDTAAELLSYGVPIGVAGNLSAKAATKLLTKYRKSQPPKGYKRVYRGEEPDSPYTKTMNAEVLRGRYFTPDIGTARQFASRAGTTTGKVFSLDLPEKQFRIGQKMAQRRAGVKFSDEVNVPKLYKDKKKLMEGQTKFVRGRAKAARYLAPGNALAEFLEKQLPKAFKKKGGVVKKRAISKRVKVTRGDGIAKRGKTRGRIV